jgi:Ca2+-transporting ATPase
MGWPLLLLPVHIVFLELIIDPACSTVFEADPEEKNIMSRPPRKLASPLFDRRAMLISLLQGLSVLAVVFLVFVTALYFGKSEEEARTLTFASLVIANLALILTNLSWNQTMIKTLFSNNIALRLVLGGALLSLIIVLYVPFLRGLFHFSLLHPDDLLIAFLAGMVSVLWLEVLKVLSRKI